jgi:hypothetical protein
MTVTVHEISREDLPVNLISGSPKRRVRVMVRYTNTAADEGLALTAYSGLKDLADIEGVYYHSAGDASSALTDIKWSSASATTGYVGTHEVGFMCNLK